MEALDGHSTPLYNTCPCLVRETDKNYFRLVLEVFDWQFLLDEETEEWRDREVVRIAVMWVTETPVGIIVSEYTSNSSRHSAALSANSIYCLNVACIYW